ncbi:ABC transporter permease [Salicibibacter halophilus]|uniref:ABC transporter permease n=1 Tax=Salicibibacter halophilus TaxID=2502791 RepID=A0A514LK97_9BACI|nr:ABC transporter permease [Salicibibacter halophilus]QDI92288.1 ABC transporter permease [Salicibibacter halophilus]
MIYGLFRFELKKNLKDKGLLFWMLILPILFIVLFGYIFSNQTTDVTFDIPYMDEDQSEMSEQFISALGSSDTFELHAQESPDEAMEQLENGDINTFVHIPSGFEDQMMSGEENPVFFHYNPVNEESVAPVRSLIENVSYSFQEDGMRSALNDAELDADEILDSGIEIVAEEQVASAEFDTITHIIPGYTVMFTFFIMISMVMSFVKDMQNGMVARLASTPLTKYQYLLGKWFPYILIVLAQIAALLLFGYFVYGVELGNIAALFLISLALAVITTGWGLALSLNHEK